MSIEHTHIDKFAAVYAEAVLTFIDSREAQWLAWDGHSHRFEFGSVEIGDPQIPAMLFVDASWPMVLGDLGEIVDPEHEHFDPEALRKAIEYQMAQEGFGERLLKGFQERLAKLEAGLAEEEDDAEPAAPEDDS